jgi:hypothetical protein
MIFRGRITESEEQAEIAMLDGGVRLWRITCDPSNMFLHRTFRKSDLNAGGFDQGTTFIHIHTGEKRVVGADGILRKAHNKKESVRRRSKKMTFERSAKRVNGTGSAHAVL